MNEYNRGFEDALALVNNRMQNHKDKLPESFTKSIAEIIRRVNESKIVKIERDLGF